jgi:hypothetical protein
MAEARKQSINVRSKLNQVEATVLTTTNRVFILNKGAMRIRVVRGEDKGACGKGRDKGWEGEGKGKVGACTCNRGE